MDDNTIIRLLLGVYAAGFSIAMVIGYCRAMNLEREYEKYRGTEAELLFDATGDYMATWFVAIFWPGILAVGLAVGFVFGFFWCVHWLLKKVLSFLVS